MIEEMLWVPSAERGGIKEIINIGEGGEQIKCRLVCRWEGEKEAEYGIWA